jgi:hypothetical protein
MEWFLQRAYYLTTWRALLRVVDPIFRHYNLEDGLLQRLEFKKEYPPWLVLRQRDFDGPLPPSYT